MSAKHSPFPPHGKHIGTPDEEDDLYTGSPIHQDEQERRQQADRRNAAKGRAAYAATDYEMPPFAPKGSSFGGGMFSSSDHQKHSHQEEVIPDISASLADITKEALLEKSQEIICPECTVKKEADDARLRAMADLDNAKKRLIREKEEHTRFAAESILNDIIPSLDNLDLALQHAGNNDVCKDFVVGVRMTRKLMQDALAKHGLAQVGAVGEEFDPAVHEAVGMVDSPDVPDGCVCNLLSNGYTLNGRLLRPARVTVCKKG